MDVHSKPTVLYVLRHGETDWNAIGKLQGREDIELNSKGRNQAKQLAEYLSICNAEVVVSSPLLRAYETARYIAQECSISTIHVEANLTERCWGDASGMLPEERRNSFPEGKAPNQEEFEPLRVRGMEALQQIAQQFSGKTIIVVSHGAIINSMLYTLSNGEYGSFKTRLANACLNKIVETDSIWNVEFYNKNICE